jgi:hypothetical protein
MKHLAFDFSGQSGSRKDFLLSYLEGSIIFNDYSKSHKIRGFLHLINIFFLLIFYRRSFIVLLHGNRVSALVFSIVALILRKHIFVYDLGYPVVDIPRVKGFRKILFSISDHMSSIAFDHILLESKFQQDRFLKYYSSNNKFHVFYAVHSHGNSSKPSIESCNTGYLDFIGEKPYILFRGKYNAEAGLEYFLNLYLNCSYAFKQSYSLIIQGLNCSSKLNSLVSHENSHFVRFVDLFLSREELNGLIKNASFMVGQFGSEKEFPRLRYTIPHKFIESIEFCIPYLSPPRPVLSSLCGDIFVSLSVDQSLEEVIVKFNQTYHNVNRHCLIDDLISENVKVINLVM